MASSVQTGTPALAVPRHQRKYGLSFLEICNLAYATFKANKVRFGLTALGMMIGTCSLILVVTIALTGKAYVLSQIQGIGANMIYAYYEGGTNFGSRTSNDFLTTDDATAVRQQVTGIKFSSPMYELHTRISVGSGKERAVLMLGVSPDYMWIRNLAVPTGRFFANDDTLARNKVAMMTVPLATRLYGSPEAAIGQQIRLSSLPFTVIGTFKEKVETFGQSEVAEETILIPYTVARYFSDSDTVKQLFFSVSDSSDVPRATAEIQKVLHSRHRAQSVYHVENLTELLSVANNAATALNVVLLLIACVTLTVSGVGIMNIMLATVSSRVREIGVRKAVGATRRDIQYQFLSEAVLIAIVGGLVGIIVGLSIPLSLRWFVGFHIPISGPSVIIAIAASSVIGVIFGTVPANRAANLDPVEALRYE